MKKKKPSLSRLPFIAFIFLILVLGSLFFYQQKNSRRSEKIVQTASFTSGRIAFVHNYNIWVARPNGNAEALTHDAENNKTETSSLVLGYSHPLWAPDGKKLVFSFSQFRPNGPIDKTFFLSDGKSFISPWNPSGVISMPRWIDSDSASVISFGKYDLNTGFGIAKIITRKFQGNEELDTNYDPNSYKFVGWEGCGGGGRPAWSGVLSANHGGGMEGIRNTFIYLKDEKKLIYSSGCEQETVYVSTGESESRLFDPSHPGESGIDFTIRKTPQEFVLSPDGSMLAGTFARNIVLYSLDGKLIRLLTTNARAFGPVFSPDGKSIYYADNVGEKVTLKRVSVEGGSLQTLYTSPYTGAISNINFSPNGKEILFTRIDQVTPQTEEGADPGEAKQSLYLINADGNNPRLFLVDASQGSWGE